MRVANSLVNLLLLEVAQKGGGCLIPGKIKGEVAWGSYPVEDVPALAEVGVGLDGPLFSHKFLLKGMPSHGKMTKWGKTTRHSARPEIVARQEKKVLYRTLLTQIILIL